MSIVIYARKSVERENSISCETQLEYCRAMIRPDERSEEIIPIVDNGFSGGNVNREGFQRMMKLISQGKVSKVIVYKIDRISRSLSDFMKILDEFKAHQVQFVSSQESFDTTSPYGEMIIKLLMVFAEFERTSTIERVTQAYAHRSEMGFYMGGRRPYGFELVPAVIHNIKTKKLEPIPEEMDQVRYIFEVYAQEAVSLRRLQNLLVAEKRFPLDGSHWTTSKLSTLLKNPIYVKADSEIYGYFDRRGVQIISDISMFTGEYGAQLYGQTKHKKELSDWSDMKLVLLSHQGVIDSDLWLKCQRKLANNRQITNSYSSATSWLAGKVICQKCGHTMTTVKGKINKKGEIRRYFNCTGKSHKKICTGTKVTIYAEDLETMVYDCITEKFAELSNVVPGDVKTESAEINEIKLKIQSIEKSREQIVDMLLSDGINNDMKDLLNQRATQLKKEQNALNDRMEEIHRKASETAAVVDFAESWKSADYECRKSIAALMIHEIVIDEDGNVDVVWNI
ncbi:MAG: recombinase family protein [Clostridia bacterium]|nr:recombinase family protein [Clostridia bacterium]